MRLPWNLGPFLRYWGRFFGVAFPTAWGWAGFVGAVLGFAIPVYLKRHPEQALLVSDLQWQVPLGILGFVSGFRLLMTPWWIHQEDVAKTDSAEKALADLRADYEPRRPLDVLYLHESPFVSVQSEYDHEGVWSQATYYRIGITNQANKTIHGVSVRLVSIEPAEASIIPGHALAKMQTEADRFDVAASGPNSASEYVNVVYERYYANTTDRRDWYVYFAGDRAPRALPKGNYTLTLRIQGGPEPVEFRASIWCAPFAGGALGFDLHGGKSAIEAAEAYAERAQTSAGAD